MVFINNRLREPSLGTEIAIQKKGWLVSYFHGVLVFSAGFYKPAVMQWSRRSQKWKQNWKIADRKSGFWDCDFF